MSVGPLFAAWMATNDWATSRQFFLDNHAALHTVQTRQVLHQMVATGAYGAGPIHTALLDERMRGHGAIGYLYLTALRPDHALDQLTLELAAQPDLAQPVAALIDIADSEPEWQGHATVLRATGLALQGHPDHAVQLISTVHRQISTQSRLQWIDRLQTVATNPGHRLDPATAGSPRQLSPDGSEPSRNRTTAEATPPAWWSII